MKRALALGVLLLAAASAGGAPFDNLVRSRFVHCAFYRGYDRDPASGDPVLVEGRSDSLTHFQRVDDRRARRISTRSAGAREVSVVATAKYLHYVERAAGFYVLTTVYGCIGRDPRTGTCVTYGAMQSRHFDARVLSDPDAVYESLKDRAEPGFCDHSFIGLKEASSGR